MESNNQEEDKSYPTAKIKSGLKFYYNLLDKVDPFIFTEENFPLKRGDIIITLNYLENIPLNHIVNNLVYGHPTLTLAIESIESLEKLDPKKEPDWSKWMLIMSLEYLLNISYHILHQKFVFDYQDNQTGKTPKQALSKLIEQKAYFKNNLSSFPSKYLKLVNDFIEVEMEKNSSLLELDTLVISKEANDLLINYLTQINESIESNDLYSSLRNGEFEKFIFKFKRLLFIPSYFDITKSDRERVFHIFLLGVLEGRLNNYITKSNKESGFGRYDICLNPIEKSDPGIVIEIKKVKEDSKDEEIQLELDLAIEQIKSKNYIFELHEDGVKKIILISIVFNGLIPNLKWIFQT